MNINFEIRSDFTLLLLCISMLSVLIVFFVFFLHQNLFIHFLRLLSLFENQLTFGFAPHIYLSFEKTFFFHRA